MTISACKNNKPRCLYDTIVTLPSNTSQYRLRNGRQRPRQHRRNERSVFFLAHMCSKHKRKSKKWNDTWLTMNKYCHRVGDKPLPEPVVAKISDAIWRREAARWVKARPASGYNPIIKNLNFSQVKIQINTLPMWHCAKMCNWCKLMQMIIQTNNFYTKYVHVLPGLTQFREGGVMTCQSPRDTLTGMWGNLVYHIWESQRSAHK